jgi:hypothetical protein
MFTFNQANSIYWELREVPSYVQKLRETNLALQLRYQDNVICYGHLCSYFRNPTAHREEPFVADHSVPDVVYENIHILRFML